MMLALAALALALLATYAAAALLAAAAPLDLAALAGEEGLDPYAALRAELRKAA